MGLKIAKHATSNNSNGEFMTETKIDFPQPEVEVPRLGTPYFYVASDLLIGFDKWQNAVIDADRLAAGSVYLTEAAAEQRAAWNKQDMARLVVPKWFRDLGPDVELFYQSTKQWTPVDVADIDNWSERDPSHYRAKPKPAPDVVVTVNGKDYRWPATVKDGEPPGVRYGVHLVGWFGVTRDSNSHGCGPRTHHTREGAEAQCAALNAVLGVE